MGSAIFSYVQYGIESTRGTAVAATRVLGAAPKAIPLDRVWTPVKYSAGRRSQYSHKHNSAYLVRDSLVFDNDHPLYFQALPVIHQCSLDGSITPSEVTPSQSDYRWDVAPSMTAANEPDTLTIELGDDVQNYEIEFCMFDNLKMASTIAPDGGASPVTGEFSYFGRQVSETTKTASQALHTGLEIMNGKLSRLYVDTTWAGVGGTEVTSLLRGWELEIMTGNEPKFFGDANKYFSTYGEGHIGAMVTLDLEGTSTADTSFFDRYTAGTECALELQVNGSQIGSGTTYNYTVSLFGYFAEVVALNQVVGSNNLHRALFVAKEDASGNLIDIDITSNVNVV